MEQKTDQIKPVRKNGFQKGHHHSLETRKKISESHKGKVYSKELRLKMSIISTGEKNHAWKGDKVGYSALHNWIRKYLGKANHCEECGLAEIPSGKKRYFQWANLSRRYRRDLKDWKQLCIKCHVQYDRS